MNGLRCLKVPLANHCCHDVISCGYKVVSHMAFYLHDPKYERTIVSEMFMYVAYFLIINNRLICHNAFRMVLICTCIYMN